jgi:flavin-dependent dehydrogenase
VSTISSSPPRGRRSTDLRHSITIRRADLVATLRAAAATAGVGVVTGERVTDAEPAGDGVRVTLANGSTVDADLLVGADGMSFGLKHFFEKATGRLYNYDVGELPVRALRPTGSRTAYLT